jgi:hypothetical protein
MGGFPYFVNGNTLNRLNADYTVTSLGTVSGVGKVSMAENGTQVMVLVPGGNGYTYNKDTATFAQITDPDFTANGLPQTVIFVEGYFMCNTDTKKIIVCSLNDGSTWDPLDFGTAEADPDPIVSMLNYRSEAFALGSKTIQSYTNIGGADFPFQASGLVLDKGCFARHSPITTSGTFMFIGGGVNESPSVWSFQGNGLVQISNAGVDLLLGALTESQLGQVLGYTYKQDNSTFVCWGLPTATIVYGVDTGKWHLRKSQVTDAVGNVRTVGWRSTAIVSAFGKMICFDAYDGRVGDVSLNYFDEYGTNIQREFDANAIRSGGNVFTVPRIELGIEAGVGDATTTDPKIRMKTSRDSKMFGAERLRSMGALGNYEKRVVWRANGRAKKYLLLRFLMSEKVRPVITSLTAELGGGAI